MKTIKFMLVAIFAIVTLSCTVNDTPDVNWHTEDITIYEGDWYLVGKPNQPGSYYEYLFYDFPYVDGIVSVYMYQFDDNLDIQIPLPYTIYEVDENAADPYYSVQYSYDMASDGSIAFKIHVSDYWTTLFHPGTITFRVAIIW